MRNEKVGEVRGVLCSVLRASFAMIEGWGGADRKKGDKSKARIPSGGECRPERDSETPRENGGGGNQGNRQNVKKSTLA